MSRTHSPKSLRRLLESSQIVIVPADHPDPEFTPTLAWGDPIPALWQQVALKNWRVWPPIQFRTCLSSNVVTWRREGEGSSIFLPDAEISEIAPGSVHECGFGGGAPAINWGDPIPSRWARYEDGRASAQLGRLRVRIGPSELLFRDSFRRPQFHYPSWAINVPSPARAISHVKYHGGPLGSIDATRSWARPAPDHRWALGTLLIESTELTFVDASGLLPLHLPSEAEVAAAEQDRMNEGERLRGERHYLSMISDLVKSEELMKRVGDDRFSAQVQRFLSDQSFRRKDTGARIFFTSDRNFGVILSILRRYGEDYMMYDCNWAEGDPVEQARLKVIFEEVGCIIE